MFLNVIRRKNPALIDTAVRLHQEGKLPANSYVIDLDTVRHNARVLRDAGDRLNLKVFAMTKQMGRNPAFCRAVHEGGIEASVAVDMECARTTVRAGMRLGHLGHLVQVPRAEASAAAAMKPDFWTVFNMEKAEEAARASGARGRNQALLARVFASGDRFYRGHEGGFPVESLPEVAARLDTLEHAHFAGITTFPALLYDEVSRKVRPTPNLTTLARAAGKLASVRGSRIEINAPGTTSSAVFDVLVNAGATQVEPGHGLTGTTPLHAVEDLPERPAVVYLTEVSHMHAGQAFCFGGGLYIDPVFQPYQVKAVVSSQPGTGDEDCFPVEMPAAQAIDYYAMIDPAGRKIHVGDSVVFGFRIQAFVTRAYVAGVSGIGEGTPRVECLSTAHGWPANWPG